MVRFLQRGVKVCDLEIYFGGTFEDYLGGFAPWHLMVGRRGSFTFEMPFLEVLCQFQGGYPFPHSIDYIALVRMTISRFMECFRTAPCLSVCIMMSLAQQTPIIQTCFFHIMRKRIYLWTNKLLYFCFILLSGLCLLSIYRAVLMFVCTVTYFGNMGNLKRSLLAEVCRLVDLYLSIWVADKKNGTWRSRTSCSDGISPTTLYRYYIRHT